MATGMLALLVGIVGGGAFLGAGYVRPRFAQPILRAGLVADLTHAFVNGALLDIPISWLLRYLTERAAFSSIHGGLAAVPIWQQGIVLFVGGDLLKWVTHRLQHAVPILWQLHQLHHSSEQLDALSHARSHPIEFLINRTPFLILFVVVLGIDLRLIAMFSALDLLQGLWAHSNTQVKTPRLSRVVATQEFHHWHHALDKAAIDKNFGGFLSVWDWLFGTAYCPEDRSVSGFGIRSTTAGTSYIDHLMLHFRSRKRVSPEGAS